MQTKYDNLKYNSKRLKSKLTLVDVDYEENEIENGNNAAFVNQLLYFIEFSSKTKY